MGTLNEYRDRPHWSYSAINQFLNICNLQFYFDRIARLPKRFTPVSLSFGSAFHRTCEWLALSRKDGTEPKKDQACDLFDTLWGRQTEEDQEIRYDEGQDADSASSQGRDMIAALVDSLDRDEQVMGVSEAFAVPLVDQAGNVLEKPLVGETDCRVLKDGQQVIVDWKLANTGTKPFETHHYAHNFFAFGDLPVGPDYVLSFPYDYKAGGLAKEQKQVGRDIQFIDEIPKAVNMEVQYPRQYEGANELTVKHTKSGHSIHCVTSVAGIRTAIHAHKRALCPEQFVALALEPGEKTQWIRTYTFGRKAD